MLVCSNSCHSAASFPQKIVQHKYNTAADNNLMHIQHHPYHDMDEATAKELRLWYAPYNHRLSTLLGRPLPQQWEDR